MRGWVVVVVGVTGGCAGGGDGVPVASVPEVEVFGPGGISSDAPEFAITFSPDGDTAYFNRPCIRRDESQKQVHGGGLPRAICTQQA